MWQAWDLAVDISLSQLPNILERNVQYNASSFFEEQLTAFEVWLKYGGEKRPPPEQVMIDMPVESENTPRGSGHRLPWEIINTLFYLLIATNSASSTSESSTSITCIRFIRTLS